MTALTPARESDAARRGRVALRLLGVLLGVFFFPNLLWQPSDADNLDPSWQWSLAFATAHGFQWGRNYIFTYGPLGYLNEPNAYGRYDLWLGGTLFTLGGFALLFGTMAFVRQPASTTNALRRGGDLLVALIVFDAISFQYSTMWNIDSACYVLLCRSLFRGAFSWWLALAAALLLALCALVKTTFLFGGAALCLSYLVAVYLLRLSRQITPALILTLAFPLAYFLLFLAAGQQPENLFAFLTSSFQIVTGYSAMAVTGDSQEIAFALALIALYLGVLVLSARRERAYLGLLLLSGPILFLNWKEAFTRHNDAHYAGFFTTMLFVFWLHAILGRRNRYRPLFLGGALACFTFLATKKPITLAVWRLEYGATNIRTGFALLEGGPSGFAAHRAEVSVDLRRHYQLPAALVAALRPLPTLIVPTDLVLAPAYGLPLALPPVPQAYSAYTAPLDRTNRRWLERTPPPQALFSYTAIDGRYPLFDSPTVSDELLRRY